MLKLDEINRLLSLAGVPLREGDALAVEKMADLLDEQEVVSHAAKGSHAGIPGVLVTTDSRILFAGLPIGKKKKSDLKVVSLLYERVESIQYSAKGLGAGGISIMASGARTDLTCNGKQVKAIAEHIHAGSPNSSPLVAGKLPTTKGSSLVKIVASIVAILIILNLFSKIFENDKSSAPQVQPVQHETIAKQQIAKKDGTYDERPNDLDELCKDWVFYKARAYKYGREGDQEAAQDARNHFQQTNVWLEQYKEEDVTTTCAQYDTKENLKNYMR